MRTRTVQLAILAAIMLSGAGCDYTWFLGIGRPAGAEPPPLSPQRPAVLYAYKMTPALSELDFTRVIRKMAKRTKEPIWFIRVNPTSGNGRTVIAYGAPEKETPRVRRGYRYHIWLHPIPMVTLVSSPEEYIQIAKPGETFAGPFTVPTASELPFSPPTVVDPNTEKSSPMVEDEVIRIVDFIRQPSNYQSSPLSQDKVMVREIQELPLLSISRRGDRIEVTFGHWFGSASGYGRMVALERTPTGYRIVSWGEWMS